MIKKIIISYLSSLLLFLLICSSVAPQIAVTSSLVPAQSQVTLPILMYHGITSKQSQVGKYFIHACTFESDLKYIKKKGYETITGKDLVNFVSGKRNLPKKPIMITFDDGYCNNYNYAYPLLKKYHMKAVVSVIGSACQEASQATYRSEGYCNMTWEQVEEVSDSGIIEIGNHTWNLHKMSKCVKGASKKVGESKRSYQLRLEDDLRQCSDKIKIATGITPTVFPWPFGFASKESLPVLESLGIKVTMTCVEGVNTIKKGDPNSLFNLKRQLRTPKSSPEELLKF